MSDSHDPEHLVSTPEENSHLESLDPAYLQYSEMTVDDRQFLNSLILRNKPRKVLEIGTSSGASAVVILNALKDVPNAQLYTIDLMKNYYYDSSKKSGFIIDEYSELAQRCHRYSGGMALDFIDEIGDHIDMVLIDTAHQNPGEILDTLMVLPYLADNAIISYHDVNLHTVRNRMGVSFSNSYTTNLLMSTVRGQKVTQGDWEWSNTARVPFPNIGAIRTESTTRNHAWELLNLLTIKWSYIPSVEQESSITNFLSRHYPPHLMEYLEFVFAYQRSIEGFNLMQKTKQRLKTVLGPKRIRAIVRLLHRK